MGCCMRKPRANPWEVERPRRKKPQRSCTLKSSPSRQLASQTKHSVLVAPKYPANTIRPACKQIRSIPLCRHRRLLQRTLFRAPCSEKSQKVYVENLASCQLRLFVEFIVLISATCFSTSAPSFKTLLVQAYNSLPAFIRGQLPLGLLTFMLCTLCAFLESEGKQGRLGPATCACCRRVQADNHHSPVR